ncbi:MAG: hypothetical protein EA380_10410 [Phycisphaeraceae bacterium]|nr:MAG: hypothetical protein EA380_10410 [Phycisphaeraceae bacterium]
MLALIVALFRDLAYLVFEVMAIGFVALRSTFDLARVSIYLCIVVATLLLRYEEAYLEQRTRLVIAKGIIADILWNRTEWIGSRALKRS